MVYDNIQTLLDKYFEGSTTVAEERQLKAYFQQQDIPADYLPYKQLFEWQVAEKEISLPSQFQDKLLIAIENQPKSSFLRRILLHPASKAAAVITLVMGMWWAYQVDSSRQVSSTTAEINWEQYQPQTAEEALTITRNAMIMISKELNRGTAKVAKEVVKVRQLGRVD